MREKIIANYLLNERQTDVLEYLGKGYSQEGIRKEMRLSAAIVKETIDELKLRFGCNRQSNLAKVGLWMILDERPVFDEDEGKPQLWQCPSEPTGCGQTKDIGSFPFWQADVRCSECIEFRVEDRKKRARRKRAEAAVVDFTKALREKQANLPHIAKALGEFLDESGGYSEFIRTYVSQVRVAEEKEPGSKYVLDHKRDIMRLWKEVSSMESADKAIEAMNIDEVQEFMVELMFKELGKAGRERILGIYMEEDDGETDGPDQAAG